MNQERREYQRLALTKPLDGFFGEFNVRILDVSAKGVKIEAHADIAAGMRSTLRFAWRDHQIEIEAETVRDVDDDITGLRFLGDTTKVRELIAESATEVLRAQEANLQGERERNIISGEETLTVASAGMRAAGFVMWTLTDNGWKKRKVLLPDQPHDGFTVAAHEADEQVELLRNTYENGDAEARRITRLLAELSVATVRQVP